MRFVAALSKRTDWREALAELLGQVDAGLAGGRPDVALLFVHHAYREVVEDLIAGLRRNLYPQHLLGCTGSGIIGVAEEVEGQPSISLLVGHLPEVEVHPLRVTQDELEEQAGPAFWHFQFNLTPDQQPVFLMLGDPFSLSSTSLVAAMNEAYPGSPMIGGLASGGQEPGMNRLFCDGEIVDDGMVGWGLTGQIGMRALVSHGCKPIGEPFTVTRAAKNIILELGGRAPLTVLQEMLPKLSSADQQLAQRALVLGRVVNEYQEDYRRGDFLIRNLIGHDPQSGAMAVGDWMQPGQTVQFQVRDPVVAGQDFREQLMREAEPVNGSAVRAALLFSCLGRGRGMYGVENHDVRLLQEILGPVPTAGVFCNGEIGPVGGSTYVHGFTGVVGLLTESTPETVG